MFSLNPIGKRFGQHCLIMFSSFILVSKITFQGTDTAGFSYCLMLCLLLLMLRISTTSDPTISPGSAGLIVNYTGREANSLMLLAHWSCATILTTPAHKQY